MKTRVTDNNVYLYLLISLFLFSCKESEEEINLGNNFYYIPFQEIIFDVTSFGGNGIYQLENNKKIPVILSDIDKYKYNSDFIIVKQNFDIEKTSRLIENMIFMPKTYFTYDKNYIHLNENYLAKLDESENNSIYYEKFTRELLEKTSTIQKMKINKENYYVIEKKEFKINGPLTKSEFKKIKQNHIQFNSNDGHAVKQFRKKTIQKQTNCTHNNVRNITLQTSFHDMKSHSNGLLAFSLYQSQNFAFLILYFQV